MESAILLEKIYKEYRLGVIGKGTLYKDLHSWFARITGKEDPNSIIGFESSENLSKNILALNNISLSINKGDKLGIIGHNGAGKSTLLKLLSRITAPTKGLIKINGSVSSLLEVGTGFHPELTGKENIYLNGAINGLSIKEIDDRIDRIINFSEIKQFIDTPVKRYSTGMFVKLGFAVAAHLEPDVLIVDEVLAVGDASFREKAISKMNQFSENQDSTLIFVSHNMQSIKELCNRVILIENGKIIYDGNTNETIKHYLSRSLNQFSGKNKFNFTNRKGGDKFKFTNISFQDGDENELLEIISGEKLIIKLEYTKNMYIDKLSFLIDLRIRDSSGNEITALSSNEMGSKFNDFDEKGVIKIYIDKLLLRGGTYFLDIYSSIHLGNRKTLDNIMNACKFDVIPSDYYNSGKVVSSNSIILLDSKIEN
ncbi:ABC transporter ATP-binding protein [Pelagibacteraceae bacterium]|nr:ABC transporter ATP-binding protein [Pelagibacteraceae bacterium]